MDGWLRGRLEADVPLGVAVAYFNQHLGVWEPFLESTGAADDHECVPFWSVDLALAWEAGSRHLVATVRHDSEGGGPWTGLNLALDGLEVLALAVAGAAEAVYGQSPGDTEAVVSGDGQGALYTLVNQVGLGRVPVVAWVASGGSRFVQPRQTGELLRFWTGPGGVEPTVVRPYERAPIPVGCALEDYLSSTGGTGRVIAVQVGEEASLVEGCVAASRRLRTPPCLILAFNSSFVSSGWQLWATGGRPGVGCGLHAVV